MLDLDQRGRHSAVAGILPGLAVAVLLSVPLCAARAAEPLPSPPRAWVTDPSGLLPAETRARLDARLRAFERATGHQVVVWIGESIGGQPLEDWAARVFAAWGIGRKGKDNGVALFVLSRDRRARIEVGYGLEGLLPDARASRIIREILEPGMRAGKPAQAIPASVDAIMRAVAPDRVPGDSGAAERAPARRPIGLGTLILMGIGAILFLVLLVTHPSLALFFLYSIISGGRGGGGGGGFSGGGGRSGGGGASGGW